MPKISYTLIVKEKGKDDSTAWKERDSFYPDSEIQTAEQHGKLIIESWNNTLRAHENAREFVRVEDILEHDFISEEE